MIRDTIGRLSAGLLPGREEAREALRDIMHGEATPAQIAAFLMALRIHGETAEIITGCAEAMREAFTPVETGGLQTIDIVGTGGDSANTFNISTSAAIVAAAAGACVAKHGSRRASSLCGSADVLQALGVNIECGPQVMTRSLKEIGLAFLFAITLHPAMKHAAAPRREIGIRTLFNILGPLANPAGTRRGVIGVYQRALVPVVAESLTQLGADHTWVVFGEDGLDELTLTGPSLVAQVQGRQVHQFTVRPEDAGLKSCAMRDLEGGDAETNAQIIRNILAGKRGAHRDAVVLNTAAALVTAGVAVDLPQGARQAESAIDSGAAKKKLDELIALTRG